jgi:tetratricopeptide (TPR) repeat protein
MNPFFSIIRKAAACELEKEFTKAFNLYAECENFTSDVTSLIKIKSKMAWCQHSVGNPKETEAQYSEILAKYAHHPLSILVYSKYLIKLKKFKSAKLLLKEGIHEFPTYLEFYLSLASLLKEMDRTEESIEILKDALAREDLSKGKGIGLKDIWAELGTLFFSRSDYNSALACLRKSQNLCAEYEFLHYDLISLCYLELEDPENALRSIKAFISYQGDVGPETLIILSRAKCRLGLIEEAGQHLIQAYSYEDSLRLNGNEMIDFAPLLRNGFFTTLENVEWED